MMLAIDSYTPSPSNSLLVDQALLKYCLQLSAGGIEEMIIYGTIGQFYAT